MTPPAQHPSPATEHTERTAGTADTTDTPGTGPTVRVVLVDDHPVVRAGLHAILESFPEITVVAEGASGEDALRLTGADGAGSADGSDGTPKSVDVVAVSYTHLTLPTICSV